MSSIKERKISFRVSHYSRLHRLRDIQANSSKTSTVNIFDVDVKDQPSEESGTIMDGPFSKCINDVGYFTFYDEFNDRNIVVAHRKLGESNAFLREHNIRHRIDLKTTRDDSFLMLRPGEKEKNYGVIKTAVLEIADARGNLCIYCVMGRSRSPAFIAAYLVVVCCYSTAKAYAVMSEIYKLSRSDERGIDRDRRFWPYVQRLEYEVSSLAW
jgi:hypothetical protein